MKTKKAQLLSIDLLIGVVLFILMFSVFFGVIIYNSGGELTQLRDQSEIIFIKLDSSTGLDPGVPQIFSSSGISEEKVKDLYFNTNYQTLKSSLGISVDFCIVLLDESGGIREFTDPNDPTNTKRSFGPNHLFVAPGIRCGE